MVSTFSGLCLIVLKQKLTVTVSVTIVYLEMLMVRNKQNL